MHKSKTYHLIIFKIKTCLTNNNLEYRYILDVFFVVSPNCSFLKNDRITSAEVDFYRGAGHPAAFTRALGCCSDLTKVP